MLATATLFKRYYVADAKKLNAGSLWPTRSCSDQVRHKGCATLYSRRSVEPAWFFLLLGSNDSGRYDDAIISIEQHLLRCARGDIHGRVEMDAEQHFVPRSVVRERSVAPSTQRRGVCTNAGRVVVVEPDMRTHLQRGRLFGLTSM